MRLKNIKMIFLFWLNIVWFCWCVCRENKGKKVMGKERKIKGHIWVMVSFVNQRFRVIWIILSMKYLNVRIKILITNIFLNILIGMKKWKITVIILYGSYKNWSILIKNNKKQNKIPNNQKAQLLSSIQKDISKIFPLIIF